MGRLIRGESRDKGNAGTVRTVRHGESAPARARTAPARRIVRRGRSCRRPARVERRDADDIGRQQIAGELNSLERTVERTSEAMGKRGFADAGYILEQHVSSGQQTDDGHLYDMGFSLDDTGNIVLNGLKGARYVHLGLLALVARK